MKIKVKKLVFILPLIIVSIISCFALSSCAFSPTKIEFWYLESIEENGKIYNALSEECYKNEFLSTDYLVFKFNDNGKMTVTHIDGKVENGTFKEKYRSKTNEITVNLENGVTLKGDCGKFGFDGVWYRFFLSDGKVTYKLTERNASPKIIKRAMFLKEAYPEIAALTAEDISKINLNGNESDDKTFIEKFVIAFKTDNFLKETHFFYPDYNSENYYTVTVFTQTSSYTFSIRARCDYKFDYKFIDINYENEYYELRGDLAELLSSRLKSIII